MFSLFSPRDKKKNGSSKDVTAKGSSGKAAATPEAEPASGDPNDPVIEMPSGMPKVVLEDFDLLKVLGKGGFGKVMLVRKKKTTDIYAMKVLKKEAVIRRNQVAHTKTETHILKQIRHPFLTRMYFGASPPLPSSCSRPTGRQESAVLCVVCSSQPSSLKGSCTWC